MARTPTIFITYNPGVPQEETLAVRLQTIASINGFESFLPDRYGKTINDDTIHRINSSDYFVIFATGRISKLVESEMNFAFEHLNDPQKIFVIYDQSSVRNLPINTQEATLIPFDVRNESVDQVINKIVQKLSSDKRKKKVKEEENGLLALLGIGLGLLALATLFSSKD